MSDNPVRPYGSWPSPISANAVAAGALRLGDLQMDGADLYWVESRPAEQGRYVVVRYRDGDTVDVIPPPYSARTTVHEYGGGALRVAGGIVYFANMADQRVYRVTAGEPPNPVTPELGDVRFADMVVDTGRRRLISVVEDHHTHPPTNDIRAIDLGSGELSTLVAGNDFYASPRLNADGTELAWLTWNQPDMPWDGCELWVATVGSEGQLVDRRLVAGGGTESIFQPAWSPQDELHFCSDRTGWWNAYRVDRGSVVAIAPMDAECGRAAWVFGLSTYAFSGPDHIAMLVCHEGVWRMHVLDRRTGSIIEMSLPFTDMARVVAHEDNVAMLAGGPRHAASVVTVDIRSGAHQIIRASSDVNVDPSVLSTPQPVSFVGYHGATSYGFYYPPHNAGALAPAGERPPLRVYAHGGPTSAVSTALDLTTQYWTSRGWAVLAVNYGGSTGYGRAYRRRLNGQEGVVDVEDCIAGARHLAASTLVDGARLTISGGSAGGYIVLCALTFHDVFAAGADYYGIGDWEPMIAETHKFEARYFDTMIGPYPQRRDLFYQRSPIHYIDRVRRPVIIMQGDEDVVVPPNQSEMMYNALRERGVPVAYILFQGEQHGFRKATTIERAVAAEQYFLSRVLGIEPADSLPPIEIANL